MSYFSIIIILFLLFIFYLLNYYINYTKNILNHIEHIEHMNSSKSLNNNTTIINYQLKDEDIQRENCFSKCDRKKCMILYEQAKNLNKCSECQKMGKCFHKSMLGGYCDDCGKDETPDSINCYDTKNFGCTNPKNFNDFTGVEPYFIEYRDYKNDSLVNEDCLFCWEL